MGRKILFVTTDQQRFDAIGCNGGIARTPVVDGLAADGIRYDRAHPQNVVCMPSRATIVTGQHVRRHGVWMNGVRCPRTRRPSPVSCTTPATAPPSSASRTSSRSWTRSCGSRRTASPATASTATPRTVASIT